MLFDNYPPMDRIDEMNAPYNEPLSDDYKNVEYIETSASANYWPDIIEAWHDLKNSLEAR